MGKCYSLCFSAYPTFRTISSNSVGEETAPIHLLISDVGWIIEGGYQYAGEGDERGKIGRNYRFIVYICSYKRYCLCFTIWHYAAIICTQ